MSKKVINLSKYQKDKNTALFLPQSALDASGITITDRDPPVSVGIMLPDQKVIFHPQYSFLGTGQLDLHTRERTREICEAFAYVSGLPVAIKWDGRIEIVKYDAAAEQYIK
jgi:hypothetical protein